MTKFLKLSPVSSTIILVLACFISFSIVANALTEADIVYPIAELDNCKDKTECKTFCNNPDNIRPCVDFAERYNLLSKDEVKKAKAVINVGSGPGGCKGKDECEQFCEDTINIEACLDFAQKNDLMSSEEIEEGKKVAKALREGVSLPGGCKNKTSCEAYCEDPSHMEECITFAEKAGFLPPEELEEAKKVAKAMASGVRPPGNCRGKVQCEEYCSTPENMEACMDFAVKAGLMPPEEVEQARKILPLMKQGQMPGGCRGKTECETYCQDESHNQECMDFAVKAGFMKPEEVEQFKKTGGKGPGGCKGKNECEQFCNDPANQETCFGFAKEHGLIPADQLEHLEEGTKMLKEQMGNLPPEVEECLRSNGIDIEKIQSGQMPGPQVGEQMRSCFEKSGGMGEPPIGQEGVMSGNRPGGCSSPEECGQMMNRQDGSSDSQHREGFEGTERMEERPEGMPPAGYDTKNGPPPGYEGQFPSRPKSDGNEQQRIPPEGFTSPDGQHTSPDQIPSPEQIQQIEQQYKEQYQQQQQFPSGDNQQYPHQQYNQPPPSYDQSAPPPPVSYYLDNNLIGLITKFLLAR